MGFIQRAFLPEVKTTIEDVHHRHGNINMVYPFGIAPSIGCPAAGKDLEYQNILGKNNIGCSYSIMESRRGGIWQGGM